MKRFFLKNRKKMIILAVICLLAAACALYLRAHFVTREGVQIFDIKPKQLSKAVFIMDGERYEYTDELNLRKITNTLNNYRAYDADKEGEIPPHALRAELELYYDEHEESDLELTIAQVYGYGVDKYSIISDGPDNMPYFDPLRPGIIVVDGYVCTGPGIPGLFRYVP